MRAITPLLTIALMFTTACSSGLISPPAFNGDRAFGFLQKQVDFGPRVPGSEASVNCRAYMVDYFRALGLVVDTQAFVFFDPYSRTNIPMVNVIVHIKGRTTDRQALIYMAHYDSRPRIDYPSRPELKDQGLPGANDGASGVAVMMELAQQFGASTPAANIDLVLVDGEDWGKEGDPENYLLGSKHFAISDIHGRYRFGIVLDMIGDKDQQIYREGYSDEYCGPLNDMVWGLAAKLGLRTFIDSVKYTVVDDHLSLNAGGVPAIDLIDFDYPYWHSDKDTPDKCSPQSLENVGKLLAYIAYNPSLWPKK